jgi:nucleoside-diphosphate-sugar epimerase
MAKRVLVTGGAGFIAHHLIETLIEKQIGKLYR